MDLNIKDPSKLEFSANKSDISPLEENNFLGNEQLTAIEFEKLKGRKQDRKERKKYAKHIFNFIWVWCFSILAIMVFVGFGCLKLDDSIIITLLSTTTANILALFVIVANYLFFRSKK